MEKRIYTMGEMNIELKDNPNYYPHYLPKMKSGGLTMIDIYYNIQTDIDDKANTGQETTELENQIYNHLSILITNEERIMD